MIARISPVLFDPSTGIRTLVDLSMGANPVRVNLNMTRKGS